MEYRLDELFDLQMGKTPSRNNSEYWNSKGNKWISIGDLTRCGKYINETKEFLTNKAVEESGISLIPANTVIMSFKLSIGKTAITSEPMYSNEAIMSFRDKHLIKLLPDYIYYLFLWKKWDIGVNKAVMGKTLNKATLSGIKISIHDYMKQKEIVEVLDKVKVIIDNRKKQIEELDALIKARFVEMFGDMADPKCEHLKYKLVEVCMNPDDIKCGPFGTQLNKDEYQTNGIAVWEIPQINSGFIKMPTHFLSNEKAEQLKAYSIEPGDIAMSRKGNVGKCGLFPLNYEKGIIHSDVLRIRVDHNRVNPCFLMHQFHYSGAIQRQIEMISSGAIMAGINVTKLKQIEIHIPDLEIQNKFATFVHQTDKLKVAA